MLDVVVAGGCVAVVDDVDVVGEHNVVVVGAAGVAALDVVVVAVAVAVVAVIAVTAVPEATDVGQERSL